MLSVLEWRIHSRFPMFEISEYGDVRRAVTTAHKKTGARCRGSIDQDGYIRYALPDRDGVKRNVSAHTLVIECFVGLSPTEEHEVAHDNGSRLHNHYTNLRWALSIQNHADRVIHDTDPIGSRNGRAKVTDEIALAIRAERKAGTLTPSRTKQLAIELEVHWATIYSIAGRRSWDHI